MICTPARQMVNVFKCIHWSKRSHHCPETLLWIVALVNVYWCHGNTLVFLVLILIWLCVALGNRQSFTCTHTWKDNCFKVKAALRKWKSDKSQNSGQIIDASRLWSSMVFEHPEESKNIPELWEGKNNELRKVKTLFLRSVRLWGGIKGGGAPRSRPGVIMSEELKEKTIDILTERTNNEKQW